MENLLLWISSLAIKILTLDYMVIKKILKKEISETKNLNVLDLGCGTGLFAQYFDRAKYLGVDIDRNSINSARHKFPDYKFKVVNIVTFKPKEKYDLILIVGVLHHLSDKEILKAIKLIYSALRAKGKIVIIEATPPLLCFNIPGLILRKLDRGSYVRSIEGYTKLIRTKIKLRKKYYQKGGILDYAVFVGSKKIN